MPDPALGCALDHRISGGPLMQVTHFVESYFDAWNHSDPVGVADHLAAGGIYCDIPENVQRSHDELVTSLGDFFSKFRNHYELIGEILTSSDTIAFQYQACPCRDVDNRESQDPYCGAEFMTLNGNAAMTITDYYDNPGVNDASQQAHPSSREMPAHKYAKSGLNNKQLLEYKRRLELIMRSQEAFLTSELTLPKLAQAVDCSVNHLSQVINAGFGMSFFDYLNRYRIDFAKELLSQLDGRDKAILNIAFTVGFNSNSAFYAAFKKCVGQTPAQYRRAEMRLAH